MLSTFAVIFIYILIGRLVTTHTAPRQAFLTPLASIMTGLGMWLFWFVFLAAGVGTSINITVYLFGGATLVLLAGMFQTFQAFKNVEHFWSNIIMSGLLIFPLWSWLAQDIPHLPTEFLGSVQSLKHVFLIGHLPSLKEASLYGASDLTQMPGVWASILPVSILAQAYTPSAFAVCNLMVFIAAAGTLVQAAGMQIKWSNLLLITTGALLGLTLLNPFFSPVMLTGAVPDVLIAAGFLMLAMPLLSQAVLPSGVALVPLAFTATAVALQDVRTWPFLILFAVFFIGRLLILESIKITAHHILGWVTLPTFPLLSVLIWQSYGAKTGLMWEALPPAPVVPWLESLAWLGVLGLCVGLALLIGLHYGKSSFKALWFYQGSWFLGVALVILSACLPTLPFERGLVWSQFLLLLPFWRLFNVWYINTGFQQIAYKSPWGLGGIGAVVLGGLLLSSAPVWTNHPFVGAQHAASVVRHAEKKGWFDQQKTIAVLSVHPGPRAAFGHALKLGDKAIPAEPAFILSEGNRAMFHAQLEELGAHYLWINSPDEKVQRMFQRVLKPENSYLFAVEEGRFKLKETYPHIGYTGAGF